MLLKVSVFNLSEEESSYLVKQYASRGVQAMDINGTVVLEAEDSFERCMILMAIGQQFPDYEVRMSQKH